MDLSDGLADAVRQVAEASGVGMQIDADALPIAAGVREWHAAHRARYSTARDRLVSGLMAAGYVVLPADGTWFVIIDLAASGLPADDEAVA